MTWRVDALRADVRRNEYRTGLRGYILKVAPRIYAWTLSGAHGTVLDGDTTEGAAAAERACDDAHRARTVAR